MRTAVLGLGRMGQALAHRLLDADQELVVWNRSPGRADELAADGARVAHSVAAAVSGADVVVTSLTGDDAVRDVLLPGGAAVPGLDAVVIDCSTVAPATSGTVATAYPQRFVAAPIAGAPQAVLAGKALLLVAGPRAAVESADAVLSAISASRIDAGEDPGRAALVKLLNNYLLLSGVAVLADVVSAAQAAGLEPDFLRDVLGALPVVAPGVAIRVDALLGTDHDPQFTVELGVKDLGLVGTATEEAGRRLALLQAIRAAYQQAVDAGLSDRDISAVVEPFRTAPGG